MEDVFEILKLGNGENLRLTRMPAPFPAIGWAHRIKRGADRVDQIEFKFGGNDRGQATLGKARQNLCQNMPRIRKETGTIRLGHGQ